MASSDEVLVMVRFAVQDKIKTYVQKKTDTITVVLKKLAAELFCEQADLFLTSKEGGRPLDESSTLEDMSIASGGRLDLFYVNCIESAPITTRVIFLNSEAARKQFKKSSKKELAMKDLAERTMSHLAALYSYEFLRQMGKKKSIEVYAEDCFGNTPLMYAAMSGDTRRIELLVSQSSNVSAVNLKGQCMLHFFCMSPHLSLEQCQAIIPLLEKNGLHVYSRCVARNSAAHYAISSGNIVAVKYFVDEQHYQLEIKNGAGDTCLHVAVRKGDLASVKELLEMNAPKYVINDAGELPLDIAQDMKLPQISQLLGRDLDSKLITKFWAAIKTGDVKVAKMMKEKYAPRVKEHQEAEKEKIQETRNIYSSNLKRTHESNSGMFEGLPYHKIVNISVLWSASRFFLDVLELLLEEKVVNVDYQNSDGVPLMFMLSRNNPHIETDVYKRVLEKCYMLGGNVNDRDMELNRCLHIAALTNNNVAVKFLLDKGAFTNSINSKGLSELHFALLNGNDLSVVNELIQAGSDSTYKLQTGLTVEQFARKFSTNEAAVLMSNCKSCAMSDDIFQPNSVTITLVKGTDLLSKDENGLSDPFCTLTHRLGSLTNRAESSVCKETLNPEWNDEFTFVFKGQDNIFYRDIVIDTFDYDEAESGQIQTNDFIGTANLVLDPRVVSEEQCIELKDQEGKAGKIYLKLEYKQLPSAEADKIISTSYHSNSNLNAVREMLKNYQTQSIGKAKAEAGFIPKYPVMVIPGLASTALEAWESPKETWIRERVWIDPFKIGRMQITAKIFGGSKPKKKKSKKSKKKSKGSSTGSTEVIEEEEINEVERVWLQHILCDKDGFSDPPGIKLRPVTGLAAIDYLATHPLARSPSYVFGHVAHEFAMIGYTPKNFQAAPYDWRLPPEKLEVRDNYYTRLRSSIELMREINGSRVVVMCHSMGCRNMQYFLKWIETNTKYGIKWINENIHAYFALGPPFLGAPKTLRSVVSGDQMGLDVFLSPEEGKILARGCGSIPWLFPIREDLFPDSLTHMVTKERATQSSSTVTDVYKELDVDETVLLCSEQSYGYFQDFYVNNPLYLKSEELNQLPPILQPPPVENLWCLYGINLDTEVTYYFNKKKGSNNYVLHTASDKYSGQKIGGINPRGMRITGGIGYETKSTFQPLARANKSGDGTVPYCSLAYALNWESLVKEGNIPLKNIRTVEIDGADHRVMLNNTTVIDAILGFVCEKPIG